MLERKLQAGSSKQVTKKFIETTDVRAHDKSRQTTSNTDHTQLEFVPELALPNDIGIKNETK